MINIAIVDDKLVNRNAIRQNLEDAPGIHVLFEAVNGEDFFEKMKLLKPGGYPQLVLMDIDMPVLNGIEAIAAGTIKYPGIRFLVLTVFDDDEMLFKAIQAGASGYLLKDDSASQLIDAISGAMEYDSVPMSPAIARRTLQWMKSQSHISPSNEIQDANNLLTDREIEILKFLVEGLDYKKIAERIFISPLTVRTHTAKIYKKLHVNSKAEAIGMAHKFRWV